jgi:predicted N-acetyltransferase YhbS
MIVQGHPSYYPRFGFVRGRAIGILPPEHLGPSTGVDGSPAPRGAGRPGPVVYPPHFVDLD